MLIEVDNLTESGKPFAQSYNPDQLALDEEMVCVTGATQVSGQASRKRNGVRLRGTLKTDVEKTCDRCLQPIPLRVDEEFDAKFVPVEEDRAAQAAELAAEDLDTAVFEGGKIDLDEFVREQVLLAVSTRTLCREDCKGLCPECGANLNDETCSCQSREVDPRWAALAKLKESS